MRDDGKVNTMRTLKIEQLVEQMKKETKAQLVSNMREVLPYILPGDKNDYIEGSRRYFRRQLCQKKRGDGDGRI